MWKLWSFVDVLLFSPTNETVTMSKPRTEKIKQINEDYRTRSCKQFCCIYLHFHCFMLDYFIYFFVMSANSFFYILQEQDFPEVSCQKDLPIQDPPYKMSCTVTVFKSPFNLMWHGFKGHVYNILSHRKWSLWSQEKTDERQAEIYDADKRSQRQDNWCIFTPTCIS